MKNPSTFEVLFPYILFFAFFLYAVYAFRSTSFTPSKEMNFLELPGGKAFLERLNTVPKN